MRLRRRFLLLRGLRWFPTGLVIPVVVLFILDRGFTLAEAGTAFAVQSVVVLLLELPTGGLADTIGARRVLIVAGIADLVSFTLLITAGSLPWLVAAWGIQGIYRALESGPLEAWYVSATLAADPEADIEGDLARAGTVVGMAVGAGSLVGSLLVAAAPAIGVNPLLLPLLVAMGLRALDLAAIATLISDAAGEREPTTASDVGAVVAGAGRLIVGSRALAALLTIEVLWGMGLVGFETLFPPRLAGVLDDPARAATLLGPVGTAAWLLSAVGSAAVPALSRRIGPAHTGAALRVAQGVTVAGLALLTGPTGLIVAYLATLMIHGASNTVHGGLLHAAADSDHRATVLSANSMAGHLGGGIGAITLGAVAASAALGLTTAIGIAAVLLAAAAPLYLFSRPSPAGPKPRAVSSPPPTGT